MNNGDKLTGIDFNKGKWRVQISFHGKRYYLGRFDKIEDAIRTKTIAESAKNNDFISWYQEVYQKKSHDLTGKDFGYIHVISKTNNRKLGEIAWKCQCKCGNIIYLPTSKITSGHTKSCGCIIDNMVHKSARENAKCISYEDGKRSPYRARIMRYNKSYYLGRYMEEQDAENMVLIAKTFADISQFKKWYHDRKEIYNCLLEKCNSINISCNKIIQAIYDGYYGELYTNIKELDIFIDNFKRGYEI